jgi:hypothetical protein
MTLVTEEESASLVLLSSSEDYRAQQSSIKYANTHKLKLAGDTKHESSHFPANEARAAGKESPGDFVLRVFAQIH